MKLQKNGLNKYPPEWFLQKSIWLSFPHNQESWLDKLDQIQEFYLNLIQIILEYQDVDLICNSNPDSRLYKLKGKYQLRLHQISNNDIWIRDYGPFWIQNAQGQKIILDFEFNAWGGKFEPWDKDNQIPKILAAKLNHSIRSYSMILEGGSLEFNGDGVIMTTKQCLLNPNRNPALSQMDIEKSLQQIFEIDSVIWLNRGLEGDHTDGHIDDFARFYDCDKVFLCFSDDPQDPNYKHLQESKSALLQWRHPTKNYSLKITELPLPSKMFLEGQRLPNSYANFVFLNGAILVPIFDCDQDKIALDIFAKAMPERKIIGIHSRLLIQEGGALHCMSKQEPA